MLNLYVETILDESMMKLNFDTAFLETMRF